MSEVPLYSLDSGIARPRMGRTTHSSPFLLLSSLELSDTKVYEPEIRALLGTASHFTTPSTVDKIEISLKHTQWSTTL